MPKTFYMPAPNYAGIWESNKAVASDEFEEGKSVFKFEQTDEKKATFTVVDNGRAHRALFDGLRKAWTSSVCDFEELPSANAVSVAMKRHGIAAQLPDGNWKIAAKAIIEFVEPE